MRRRWIAGLGILALVVAAPAEACDASRLRVALDVGHSVDRPGAISARGRGEYAFNLEVAEVIERALRGAGLTGASILDIASRNPSLAERVAATRRAGADLFLSIHHDSLQEQFLSTWRPPGGTELQTYSRHAAGFSLFVSDENPGRALSLRFASLLGEALRARGFAPSEHHAEAIPGEGRAWLDRANGVYRFDGLYVLRHNRVPAVLFEVGVIKHPEEERELRDPATQADVAAAVVAAIRAYCASL